MASLESFETKLDRLSEGVRTGFRHLETRIDSLERVGVDLQTSTNDNFTTVLDTLHHLAGPRAARRVK
jgi:hypothetical protein